MPELPEVETICRDLTPLIKGFLIKNISIYDKTVLANCSIIQLSRTVKNRVVSEIYRRGKYLVLKLQPEAYLIFHLKLTGQLVISPSGNGPGSRAMLHFGLPLGKTQENWYLNFYDQRRFGRIYLAKTDVLIPGISNLGPEPFSPEFSLSWFTSQLQQKKGLIKPLLMDQRFIAGIGNIYAQEALFLSKIHPCRNANTLSKIEISRLYRAIINCLRKGIRLRGTSDRNYVDAYGQKGSAQNYLYVYRRQGQLCPVCRTGLIGIKVGGRGTVYCPHCQK